MTTFTPVDGRHFRAAAARSETFLERSSNVPSRSIATSLIGLGGLLREAVSPDKSICALSAMIGADVMQRMNPESGPFMAIGVAFLVAPGVGLLCGLINGLLITLVRLHPFIVTLGTMSIFRWLTNIWTVEQTLPNQ